MHLLLAANFLSPIFDPIVAGIVWLLAHISQGLQHIGVGSYSLSLSLIILAALIRLVFWKLNVSQFKAMLGMQKLAPKLKRLQERYKGDQQKLQAEQMALYKSEGVNPLAGCWPTLIQMPILFSVYYAVTQTKTAVVTAAHAAAAATAAATATPNTAQIAAAAAKHAASFILPLAHASFLWIGSPLAMHFPKLGSSTILAPNLAYPDLLLIVFYMVTQYISMRFTTMPPTDPSQANQMKMMQIISPLMIGFFGYKYQWPSAMVLYWLSYNLFLMAQQFYMLRKYHEPLSFIDSEHAITEDIAVSNGAAAVALPSSGNPKKKSKKKR